MVSHPQSAADRPLPRAAASVTSSTPSHSHSHSRRHRYGRSHPGGSSHKPTNEFPIFASSGDVEIVIRASNQEQRYLLHRLILAQCSGFFEAGTSDDWPSSSSSSGGGGGGGGLRDSSTPPTPRRNSTDPGLASISEDETAEPSVTKSARSRRETRSSLSQPKSRWRYELDWENREDDEMPILALKVSYFLSFLSFPFLFSFLYVG